jgi:hypothetical protein
MLETIELYTLSMFETEYTSIFAIIVNQNKLLHIL